MRGILADHLARLEDGLEDARREIARLTTLLDAAVAGPEEVQWFVDAARLVDALAAVRFAVGTDPGLAVLHGVLLELDAPTCRLMATDRFRMAVADLAVALSTEGGPTNVTTMVAPTAWVDAVMASGVTGEAWISFSHNMIRLRIGSREGDVVAVDRLVPGDYPDHRRILDHLPAPPAAAALPRPEDAHPRSGRAPGSATSPRMRDPSRGEGDASTLATRVRAAGPRHTGEDGVDLVVLGVRDDRLTVDEGPGVAVRREFLLDALDALEAAGQAPVLRLDGPITPLVIRGGEATWSVLMPARVPDVDG